MKRLEIPKNKFARLFVNVGLIAAWYFIFNQIDFYFLGNIPFWYEFTMSITIFGILLIPIIILLIPSFFITRYIWFEKSRNRVLYGLFNKFANFLKPKIYTNTDELEKYAKLKNQGIITIEEFEAKKKKLLNL